MKTLPKDLAEKFMVYVNSLHA